MKEFEINDEWQILTAERDRIIFFNNYTKQLQVITPHTVTGDVVKVHNNITCLSFDLDERLNLNLWREMDSSIYVKDEDKALNYGAVFDLLNSQSAIIADLEKENKQLEEQIRELNRINSLLVNIATHNDFIKDSKKEEWKKELMGE